MPRPIRNRATDVQDRIRERIERFLKDEERGQTWFARKVAERGCGHFTPMTLHKILRAGRTVSVDEAFAIADVLGVDLGRLHQADLDELARSA